MADFFSMIGDLLGLNKGRATMAAADQNKGIIADYGTTANNIIQSGLDKAGSYLDQNNQLTSLGPNGGDIYRSALGVAGDNGAAAREAFQASPGYQFQLDQGLQALDRTAAARGELQSGQTGLDTLRFSQGLADQSWQSWLDNLTGGVDRSTRSLGDLATLFEGGIDKQLGVAGDVASGTLAANNMGAAGAEAGQGSLLNLIGTVLGIGGQVAGSMAGIPTGIGGGRGYGDGLRLGYGR